MTCEINSSVGVISNREKIMDIGHHFGHSCTKSRYIKHQSINNFFTLRACYLQTEIQILGFGWSHKKYSLSAGTLTQGFIVI